MSKQIAKLFLFSLLFLLLPNFELAQGGLLQQSNFVYEGAFRVPNNNLGGDSVISRSMGSGGDGITYNPIRNSLIMIGSPSEKLAIEMSIPVPVISNNIIDLNTATVIQAPGNIANGQWSYLNLDGSQTTNGGVVGNLLVHNGKLIGNAYAYYASENNAHLSHFNASVDWASAGSQFSGMKRVGVSIMGAAYSNGGWTGGYMCHVPAEWQARLGYPVLTGNGGIAIISRSSFGPSIWGFDPDDLGIEEITPAELFFGYPSSHPTLGEYGTETGTLYYNMSTKLYGAVFPEDSDSILIFGVQGLGPDGMGTGCYGYGTSDESLHLTPAEDGVLYCYDPIDADKGTHAYPYTAQVWAYDANDILEVKSGLKQYWEIVPYTRWTFTLPFTNENSSTTGMKTLGGVAYDPVTQKIFITQNQADTLSATYEFAPIIHVFSINSENDTIAPGAPSGLSVL